MIAKIERLMSFGIQENCIAEVSFFKFYVELHYIVSNDYDSVFFTKVGHCRVLESGERRGATGTEGKTEVSSPSFHQVIVLQEACNIYTFYSYNFPIR